MLVSRSAVCGTFLVSDYNLRDRQTQVGMCLVLRHAVNRSTGQLVNCGMRVFVVCFRDPPSLKKKACIYFLCILTRAPRVLVGFQLRQWNR